MNRRAFLQTLAAAPACAAPQSAAPVKLGFDTYSLRAFNWKLPQFLDYAAAQKLDTFQISSMSDYESYEPVYLQRMRDRAARLKLSFDAHQRRNHTYRQNRTGRRDSREVAKLAKLRKPPLPRSRRFEVEDLASRPCQPEQLTNSQLLAVELRDFST
jgi:hypothetical protein